MAIHEGQSVISSLSYLRSWKYRTPWWLSGGIAAANCVVAYQPKGAASYATSKVNLANPGTYDAADGTAYPTWNAINGWMFNGTSQWLITAQHSLNQTGIIKFTEFSGQTAFGLADRWAVYPKRGITYNSGNEIKVTPAISSGVVALTKNEGYRNGSLDTNALTGHSANWRITIGGRSKNMDGTSCEFFSKSNCQAFALYNINLSADCVAAVSAAMAAL